MMRKLSIGAPNTLGTWRKLCSLTFGPESAPTKYIEKQISQASNGEQQEVLADEGQLLMVLGGMFVDEQQGKKKDNAPA